MLKLTTPKQNSHFTIILRYADPKNLTRIRNYLIQNARIRSPALVQSMKRYLKMLKEWLLLLGTIRYLIKTRGSGFMIRYI